MSRPIRPRPVPPRPGENSEESNERKTRSLLLIPRLLWVAAKSAPIASIILLFGAVFGGIVAALELLVVQRLVDALAAALPAVVAGGVNAGAQVEAVGTVGTPFNAGAAGAVERRRWRRCSRGGGPFAGLEPSCLGCLVGGGDAGGDGVGVGGTFG